MKTTTAILLFLASCLPCLAEEERVEMRIARTAKGVRYGLLGDNPAAPAPTLFIIGQSLEDMQRWPIYTAVARRLAAHGFLGVVLEPPCHGEDVNRDEPKEIDGWRFRLECGADLVGPFAAHASGVLDELIEQKQTDPAAVAVFGTSRGGFMACHWAAVEPRLKAVAALAPPADLLLVREFKGMSNPENAEKLALKLLAPRLAGRPVWVSVPNNDTRIDTDATIAFARALVAAARTDDPNQVIPVHLLVIPAPGHTSTLDDHDRAARWLLEQLKTESVEGGLPSARRRAMCAAFILLAAHMRWLPRTTGPKAARRVTTTTAPVRSDGRIRWAMGTTPGERSRVRFRSPATAHAASSNPPMFGRRSEPSRSENHERFPTTPATARLSDLDAGRGHRGRGGCVDRRAVRKGGGTGQFV